MQAGSTGLHHVQEIGQLLVVNLTDDLWVKMDGYCLASLFIGGVVAIRSGNCHSS